MLTISVLLVAVMSVAAVQPAVATVPGDKDGDGLITLSEVVDLIDLWEKGEVSLSEVVQAINVWSRPPIFRAEEKFVDYDYVPDNGVVQITDNFIYWTFSWDEDPGLDPIHALDFEFRPPALEISWNGETVYSDLPSMSNDIEQPSGCDLDDQGNIEYCYDVDPNINDITIKCGAASDIVAKHQYFIYIPTTTSLGAKKSVPIEVELKGFRHKPLEADTFDVEIGGPYEVAYGVWGDLDKLGYSFLDDFDQIEAEVTHIHHGWI